MVHTRPPFEPKKPDFIGLWTNCEMAVDKLWKTTADDLAPPIGGGRRREIVC